MVWWLRRAALVLWVSVGLVACDGAGGGESFVDAGPGGPDGPAPDQVDGPEASSPHVVRIIAGAVDETDVAVVALTTGGRAFCSGTLVAPRTVFTAGHCVVESGLAAHEVSVFFGTRVGGPGVSLAVLEWGAHPGYFVLPDGAPLHDVAYVTLRDDAPVAPLPWQSTKLPSLVGTRVRMVGYGVTNARHQTGAGTRREVTQTILDQDAGFLYYGDGWSGTCQGDSGGPTLVDGSGGPTLVAVTSYGDESCVRFGGNTRVDANAEFLEAHLVPERAVSDPVAPPPALDVPLVAETEPNNGYGGSSAALAGPCTVVGALEPMGDVDYFRIVLPRGATLAASVVGPPDVDVDARLTSASGALLDASENGPGEVETLGWTNVTESVRVVYVRVYAVHGAASPGGSGVAYLLAVRW